MSNLSISMVGPTSARLEFTVCKQGKYITAGGAQKVSVIIEDSDELRLALANLSHLKQHESTDTIRMRFNGLHTYAMDYSIWYELVDALFAFALSVDFENLMAA